LNVLADKTTMHRFDRFNDKYSPLGDAALRTVFLKTDNQMGGRYLAEITRELLDDLEESKYQHTEWRLSIYGRKRNEWGKLARWVIGHKLVSENNQWMIQIPRLYSVFKAAGQIGCFQDLLDNLFLPLFEVSLSPEKDPELHEFLNMVSGFDSVDDESKSEVPIQRNFASKARTPAGWDIVDNPSYKYYNFYTAAFDTPISRATSES
jgi:AMP deaminase